MIFMFSLQSKLDPKVTSHSSEQCGKDRAVSLILIQLGAIKVWQYYLLPPEEQRMPGVKNPMCSAFPRVGQYQIMMWVPLCNLQHFMEKFAFSC